MAHCANDVSTNKKLADIFAKMNLSELPAMSHNVGEVLELTANRKVKAEELAKVILKDLSLTHKILQVVNSAYYNRGVPITSIERAVTALGIDVVRELAISISIIEEFLRTGVEKDGISKLLASSLLSANLSKHIVKKLNLHVSTEEAYVCSLLHELGKVVIQIYLPHVYRRIIMATESGCDERDITKVMLKQLTFSDIGMAIGRFWNFSDLIIESMQSHPRAPDSPNDAGAYLQNLAYFSNHFIEAINNEKQIGELVDAYSQLFPCNCHDLLTHVRMLSENIGVVSPIIRFGMAKLKIRSKTILALKECDRPAT